MNTCKLYYPSVTQDNKPIDQAISNTIYKGLISKLCQLNNGVSVYPVQGYYLTSAGKLINDDISLITSYTDKLSETINIMREYSMMILKSLDQESVLIEVNNSMEFISSKNDN